MKYLTDEKWKKLPCKDFRPRFFVETYSEKLSMRSPHFYQSRLMNVFSSCREALAYIGEYLANEKNGGYILSALDEIDSCLSTDSIAQFMLAQIEEPRKQLFKNIRGGNFSSGQLNRLSVICRAVLSREDEYTTSLIAALKNELFSEVDLAQKERLTTRIYDLTSLYTTLLLNKGYSPTYLFNRAEQFTRENNYSGRDMEGQFVYITEKLRSYTTNFDVFFAIRAHRPNCLLTIEDEPSCHFFNAIPESIQDPKIKKLWGELKPNVIAKLTVMATDFVSASWRTKEKLDVLLDALTALELNPSITVHAHCLAVSQNQQLLHEKSLNIDILIGFLTSESGTLFTSPDATIRHALTKLNDNGKEHIGRSLRYLRLARNSISLEQKLLNLWIALESLFADGDSNILQNIVEFVPQVYAVTGLLRRVSYIRDLLVKHEIPTTPLVRPIMKGRVVFDQQTTNDQIFKILRDAPACNELFSSLGAKEHMKFKLLATFNCIKSNKSLSSRVNRSEEDVTRQLRRIYFLRNKIAHTGHYANIRPQLITHLLDYLAVCYMAISDSAYRAKIDKAHSIIDLLSAYKMGVEVVVMRLNSSDAVDSLEKLTPEPLV